MAILEDLADYLSEETAMQVYEAVLLMSSDNADEMPRVKLFTEGVTVHGLLRSPAGLFMCVMTNVGKDPFYSEMEQGNVEVDQLERIDPDQDFIVEGHWPTRKVEIDGQYYVIPRNYVSLFNDIVNAAKVKKKRKRR